MPITVGGIIFAVEQYDSQNIYYNAEFYLPSFQVIDIGGKRVSEAWERQGWCGRGLRATDPRTPWTIYFDRSYRTTVEYFII